MDLKYLALLALLAGFVLVVYAINTTGDGAQGIDRLPLTAMMLIGGGTLVLGGGGYLIVRALL